MRAIEPVWARARQNVSRNLGGWLLSRRKSENRNNPTSLGMSVEPSEQGLSAPIAFANHYHVDTHLDRVSALDTSTILDAKLRESRSKKFGFRSNELVGSSVGACETQAGAAPWTASPMSGSGQKRRFGASAFASAYLSRAGTPDFVGDVPQPDLCHAAFGSWRRLNPSSSIVSTRNLYRTQ
jgi:hypothetical protein